jgi:phage shock protein C
MAGRLIQDQPEEDLMISQGSETPAPERSTPRLHCSARDRLFCGGIAEYLNVDSSLVRLLFVVVTLWGGVGLLLYVTLALILPTEDGLSAAPTPRPTQRSHWLAGLLLICLGALLLMGNPAWMSLMQWQMFWPMVLILLGAALLLRSPNTT